ncbi:rh5-interacting protein-like [Eupeodes corollae]|uniref:rh5-interacting protein-like n=1 Tax=Eupeodes corollae TaxID=290404 RepID=UPI002493B7B2|nr:rh5-interacting protein-like [Eupeodes corollae]
MNYKDTSSSDPKVIVGWFADNFQSIYKSSNLLVGNNFDASSLSPITDCCYMYVDHDEVINALRSGEFLDDWKTSYVNPVYKSERLLMDIHKTLLKASKMISKIFLLIGVITVVQGTILCPLFELPSLFDCDDNCSGVSRKCVPGLECTCIIGYKRDKTGKCVPQNKCCTEKNEEYCTTGTERTCDDVINPRTVIIPPIKPGRCMCKKGTARNNEGKCVLEKNCPKCTGANEVFKTKGCDTKCNLKGIDPIECVHRKNGCYCKKGYVRQNDIDKDCIRQTECKCNSENECYLINGGCEKDCRGNNCHTCPGRAGCYCEKNYVRDLRDDKCILKKHCMKECPARQRLLAIVRK